MTTIILAGGVDSIENNFGLVRNGTYDLAIQKTLNINTPYSGDIVQYTLTYQNLTDVDFTGGLRDTYDAHLSYVSSSLPITSHDTGNRTIFWDNVAFAALGT